MNLINSSNFSIFGLLKSWEFWAGLILYFSTLIDTSPILILFLLIFPFSIYLKKIEMSFISYIKRHFYSNNNAYFLLFIFLFSFINSLVNNSGFLNVLKGPYLLLPIVWVVTLFLNKRILKVLVFLTIIETSLAIIQYIFGVNSFYYGLSKYNDFSSYELLSFTRVFGLGYSPSILSIKIFLSILLIDFLVLKNKIYFWLKLFLFIGLVLSFTRTALVALYFYLALQFIIILLRKKWKLNYDVIFIFLVYIISFSNANYFKKQFTRGGMVEKTSGKILSKEEVVKKQFTRGGIVEKTSDKILSKEETKKVANKQNKFDESQGLISKYKFDKIEMSGRSEIWSHYLLYIKEHLFFGNGSAKIKIGKYHAHNSFLAVFAINGILIGFLYLVFIVMNVNKYNFLIVTGIIIIGLGQYAFFWPISYVDIVFYYLLLNKNIFSEIND